MSKTPPKWTEVQSPTEIIVSEVMSPLIGSKTTNKKKDQPEATKVSTREASQEATLISNMKTDEITSTLQNSAGKHSIADCGRMTTT